MRTLDHLRYTAAIQVDELPAVLLLKERHVQAPARPAGARGRAGGLGGSWAGRRGRVLRLNQLGSIMSETLLSA